MRVFPFPEGPWNRMLRYWEIVGFFGFLEILLVIGTADSWRKGRKYRRDRKASYALVLG